MLSCMHERIKEAVVTAWTRAWDFGDVDAFDSISSDSYTRVNSATGGEMSLAELKQMVLDVRAGLPDIETVIDRILVDGDLLAIYWHTTGTFTGTLGEVPATGNRVVTAGANLSYLEDGVIVREEVTWDTSALLRDAGIASLASAFEPDLAPEAADADAEAQLPREMLKAFNKQFISGVTVVTAYDDDNQPRGLVVSSYNSVSLDPPLVLFCVMKTSSTYPFLFRAKHVGINILSSEQHDTLQVFASKASDKFAGLDWHPGPEGSPLIDRSAAIIEVEIKERFQAMTHTVFIGRVHHAETSDDAPIVYKAGKLYDGRQLAPIDAA